jgi:hypothetical protein
MKSHPHVVAAVTLAWIAATAGAQQVPTTPAAPGAQPVVPAQPGAAPAPAPRPLPPTRWTEQQVRQSFEFADSNSDGQLTRAEAQQLAIMPRSFEEMDENNDGVVTRAEYDSQFTR